MKVAACLGIQRMIDLPELTSFEVTG